MAQITLDIPAGITNRVINAVCAKYGYQDTINDLPNPESKAAYAKRMIIKHIKDIVREQEGAAAQTTAFNTAVAAADSEVTIS